MNFSDVWENTKIEVEDGEYYGTVTRSEFKTLDNGKELFGYTIRINEGEYAGEEVESAIFYFNPDKPDDKRHAKTLKTLMSRTLDSLAEASWDVAYNQFPNILKGRMVRFSKKVSASGFTNVYIHEVFDRQEDQLQAVSGGYGNEPPF